MWDGGADGRAVLVWCEVLRIGSLFSGAAGLDRAVEAVFGGKVAWFSEVDPAASKVLAHHFPNVPNLGDITQVDWADVPPVDVLCGGFPCQDVSAAGKRVGIKDGTRSGLWSVFAEAIDALRPRWVVIENVKGLLSATAHRDMESGDATMGIGGRVPVLRAAGAVLGDLAERGYDAQWTTLAAAAVGAPHRRERVFILASAADAGTGRCGTGIGDVLPGKPDAHRGGIGGTAEVVELLPTPAACNPNDGEGVETWLARREVVKARVGNGNGMGMPLTIAVQLLPGDGAVDPLDRAERMDDVETCVIRCAGQWGKYEPAIRRWEAVLGRPSPAPTESNRNGKPRLNPEFASWMMGWPAGWVTDPAIGISRNDQLRIIGNGVVSHCATAALRYLLAIEAAA